MKTKTRILATASATIAALVMVPAAAEAGDYSFYSASGRSYMWYDDSGNRLVVCDMVAGDDVGAYGQTATPYNRQRIVYNGCEVMPGIPDNTTVHAAICDWVSRNGSRVATNCASAGIAES